jgi:hypothetical protein
LNRFLNKYAQNEPRTENTYGITMQLP